jgi:hypothetical protein
MPKIKILNDKAVLMFADTSSVLPCDCDDFACELCPDGGPCDVPCDTPPCDSPCPDF